MRFVKIGVIRMKKVVFLFISSLSYLGVVRKPVTFLASLLLFSSVSIIASEKYGKSINEDYRIAQKYRELAIEAHEEGDYERSIEFAKKSQEHSDKYIAPLYYARADAVLKKAKERGYDKSKSDIYNEASQSLINANAYLKSEDYSNSLIYSKNVIDLANLMGVAGATTLDIAKGTVTRTFSGEFPQYYKVVERTKNTDSLWRIASYDFIYGNGHLWRRIYEANKNKIKDPNIIRKGQILTIPSLKGEKREGTYNSNNTYGNIREYKK